MISIGNLQINKLCLGDVEVTKAYLGDVQVYGSKPQPVGKYMTITVDDAAGETTIHPNITGTISPNLQYRVNGGEWSDFIVGTTADIHLVAGDFVQWKGNNLEGISTEWNNYLNLVKEYILNGNIIKYNTIYKNKKIGQWYYNQLRLYRQNKLSTEKISEFKSLDLFNSKFDEKWDNNINIIIQCCNNNINIQDRTIYNGIKIGSRLRAMKQQFKKRNIPRRTLSATLRTWY